MRKDSKYYWTVALCLLTALVEGYDLQSAGIAAPRMAVDFALDARQLSHVFAINTLGLLFGSALCGWLADRFGRKWTLIGSMIVFGGMSLATAWATSFDQLLITRLLVGLGLGGALPNLIALVAEAGPASGRAGRVTMISSGMPFGGVLAVGFVIAFPASNWEAIFHIGGILPLMLAIIMAIALPESPAFAVSEHVEPGKWRELVGREFLTPSVALWITFFATMVALYLLLNWLPVLVIGYGFDSATAMKVSLAFSVGGAFGGLILGWIMRNGQASVIFAVTYVAIGLGLASLALAKSFIAVTVSAFAIGFFLIGAQFLLYGLGAELYPARMRGTGVGGGVAIGRIGAIVGPILAGVVLRAGGSSAQVILALLPLAAVSLAAVLYLISLRPAKADEAMPQ